MPLALELYQKRCRAIVERGQAESRWLARAMFVRGRALGRARDELASRYPAGRMLAAIISSARTPF